MSFAFQDPLADVPLRIVHVFLLVAWLGVDMGVFYSSFVLRRRGLSGEARRVVARIMAVLDRGPRISLVLMIPVAIGLAYESRLGLQGLGPRAFNTLFWSLVAASLVWVLAMVKEEHESASGKPPSRLVRLYRPLDDAARLAVALFFGITGTWSLVGDGIWTSNHVAWKSTIFALIVAFGKWVDLAIRDFGPALADIVSNGETPERLERLNRAVRGAYLPVLLIYASIVTIVVIAVGRYG